MDGPDGEVAPYLNEAPGTQESRSQITHQSWQFMVRPHSTRMGPKIVGCLGFGMKKDELPDPIDVRLFRAECPMPNTHGVTYLIQQLAFTRACRTTVPDVCSRHRVILFATHLPEMPEPEPPRHFPPAARQCSKTNPRATSEVVDTERLGGVYSQEVTGALFSKPSVCQRAGAQVNYIVRPRTIFTRFRVLVQYRLV